MFLATDLYFFIYGSFFFSHFIKKTRKSISEFYLIHRFFKPALTCKLKEFRFDSNNTPDYNDPTMQRFYLLRYMPAYLVEYYIMYKDMFQTNFLGENLNIISIGAGCGIDFWGCKFAADDLDQSINIRYTGIDITEWEYWDTLGIDECYFLKQDINELDMLDENNYNIIVFPKSIGELDDKTFNRLKYVIKNTDFSCDKIILLSSVRTSRDFIDIDRLGRIVNIFECAHDYSCLNSKTEYTYFEKDSNDKYCSLDRICSDFTYPQHIRNFLTSLNSRCKGFVENWFKPHEEDCKQMDRLPISTVSQIKYQVLRLEK
jgi:hypothetical protein